MGINNSSVPAEVISNLFRDDMQVRTAKASTTETYNTSMGVSIIRIKANMENYSGINNDMKLKLSNPVYGILQDDFNYSIQSDWETLELPAILDMTSFGQLAAFAGGGEIGYVARTQKYWKRSGDIKMSPKFRVLDVDGTGEALSVVHILTLMCTAVGSNLDANIKSATEGVAGGIEDIKNSIINPAGAAGDGAKTDTPPADKGGVGGLWASLQTVAKTYVDYSVDGIVTQIRNATDYATTRQAPPTLDVQIGKVFRHKDMVITNMSVTFSKEFTASGPIYADVTLEIVSRKNISDNRDIGISYTMLGVDGNPTQYGDDISFVKNVPKSSAELNKADSSLPSGSKSDQLGEATRAARASASTDEELRNESRAAINRRQTMSGRYGSGN